MSTVFERTDSVKLEETNKKRRAAKFVRRFVKKSEDYRKPHLELAEASRELYESWSVQAKTTIQRANLKLPYAWTIINTQLPQITEVFLKEEPLVKFRGQEPQDMVWADPLTDFHRQQVDRMGFEAKFITFAHALLLDGTAIAKVPYRYEEATTTETTLVEDPFTGELVEEKEEVVRVKYDGPDFENIGIQDFFPDWRAKQPGDVASMRGCVHRTFKTFNELKRSGNYTNLEELERSMNARGCGNDAAWSSPMWSDDSNRQFDKLNDNEDDVKRDELIELWEYWGEYDLYKEGEFISCLITVANGDVAIRVEENPYQHQFKPFVACVNYIRNDEFYGIPETMAVKGLIKEATALRNARLDSANLSVHPMTLVDRAAGIRKSQLVARPGGVVYTNDMQGVKEFKVPDSSPLSESEIQNLQNEITNATGLAGAAPVMSQLAKTFGRSATGASLVASLASSRAGVKVRLLNSLFVKPFYRILMQTNAQFVDREQWVRVSDPVLAQSNPFELLPPEAFSTNIDFELTTNFEENQEAEFQKLQVFAQLAQTAEATQPGLIRWDQVFDAIGRNLLGKRVAKFTRSEEERQMMQMQQLAQEQAVNAQVGRMAPQPNALNPSQRR